MLSILAQSVESTGSILDRIGKDEITLFCFWGGTALTVLGVILGPIALNAWVAIRRSQNDTEIKLKMLEAGHTPEDIERVLLIGRKKTDKWS